MWHCRINLYYYYYFFFFKKKEEARPLQWSPGTTPDVPSRHGGLDGAAIFLKFFLPCQEVKGRE
jgi:hypothetical protein